MRYKFLTKEQLLISIDRLTRFKPTKEKYFRVFTDIITSNMLEPKYKKSELAELSPAVITEFAETIINASLNANSEKAEIQTNINEILKNYENSVFVNDKDTQAYLNNSIEYDYFIKLIDESCPINVRWLKFISGGKNIQTLREKHGLKYPVRKVLLVEGLTEEILLPAFSRYLGFDFYKEGIQIIPAGGKNQVVKMYYKMSEELKIPIFLLLDKDAEENISQIKPKLRDIDNIHLVSCGEFEDLLPKSLIIKTVNNELNNFASISEEDLDDSIPEVKNLENIFKQKGLHEFKKADFAKLVRDNISEDSDISDEIREIITELNKPVL